MRITDRLRVEHGIFLHQLRLLEWMASERAPEPVLKAVAETIATAEERHSRIEERLLYPVVAELLGPCSPVLAATAAEHDEIRGLLGLIRGGGADQDSVLRFVDAMRSHMESEIHGLFVLAEEHLTDEQLSTLTNWNVEHVEEEARAAKDWPERWLG